MMSIASSNTPQTWSDAGSAAADCAAHELLRAASRVDSRYRSARHRHWYPGNADQVVGGHGELELVIDSLQSAKHGLSNPANGLAPTERLLDPLANHLADAVTRVASRSTVDRATAATGVVGSDVRCHVALATGDHEIGGVVGL